MRLGFSTSRFHACGAPGCLAIEKHNSTLAAQVWGSSPIGIEGIGERHLWSGRKDRIRGLLRQIIRGQKAGRSAENNSALASFRHLSFA